MKRGKPSNYVLVTDRGGHLANALMLMRPFESPPKAIVTTQGPEVEALRNNQTVHVIPYLFSWIGKLRFINPFNCLYNTIRSLNLALKLKPKYVISLGATNVVPFCYWARLFGAKIIHVECMNQVWSKSITGKLLYPICSEFYVQWEDLLPLYGPKAKYAGWVI